jgi:mercuric transport protein
MKRLWIVLPLLLLIALAALAAWAVMAPESRTQEVRLEVSGMVCPACPPNVIRALEALEGVQSAEVDLETRQARVRFDPAVVDVRALMEATGKAGYPSRLIEQGEKGDGGINK